MQKNYKRIEHNEFVQYIDKICNQLGMYIQDKGIKIDYICPVLRSGAVPAVYISNKLNIVKFLPIQIKHIAYKNGDNKIEMIFNPFDSIEINKKQPVFLIVEAMHSTGTSVEICINEIKKRYKDAKILYVCLTKEYGSRDFKNIAEYEDVGFYYNGNNEFSKEKCEELNIQYFYPLFSWENLQIELEHPDDLEENIFF